MSGRLTVLSAALLFCISFAPSIVKAQQAAQSDSFWKCERLTCDWGGLRTSIADRGITLSSNLTGELMANVRGGNERRAVLVENWDANIMFDMERLTGWSGARARFSVMQNNGASPSRYIGDVQTASNIEAVQTTRIYEAWLEQNAWQNQLSLLAGVYDINFEFDYTQSGALFVNSSQGIGPELASSGLVGAPTFPATALTARIKIMPSPNWYLQAAVTDGRPGVYHVDWNVFQDKGMLGIGELGYIVSGAYLDNGGEQAFTNRAHISRSNSADYLLKLSLGAWSYSRNYVSPRYGISNLSNGNDKGLYLLADVRSMLWIDERLESLSWYIRVGLADDDLSRFYRYWGSGFVYHGLFAGDPDGRMGVSIAAVQNSRIYQRQSAFESSIYEVALEGTYKTSVTPWLSVQPDLQYIFNPGVDPNAQSALVLAMRISLSL